MSDLLIRGMEMPKEEKISLTIFPDGRVYKRRGDLLRGYGEDCIPWKAISVPPHGRLGDLDALEQKIDGIWDCNDMVFKPDDHCCNVPEDCKGCKWAETKDCIQRMVANAPTIIPAEPCNNLSKPCKEGKT